MKYIYIVNTCDDWKSCSSMDKQVVTTSWAKAYKAVLKLVAQRGLEVGNRRELLESRRSFDIDAVNNSVANIYVERWED